MEQNENNSEKYPSEFAWIGEKIQALQTRLASIDEVIKNTKAVSTYDPKPSFSGWLPPNSSPALNPNTRTKSIEHNKQIKNQDKEDTWNDIEQELSNFEPSIAKPVKTQAFQEIFTEELSKITKEQLAKGQVQKNNLDQSQDHFNVLRFHPDRIEGIKFNDLTKESTEEKETQTKGNDLRFSGLIQKFQGSNKDIVKVDAGEKNINVDVKKSDLINQFSSNRNNIENVENQPPNTVSNSDKMFSMSAKFTQSLNYTKATEKSQNKTTEKSQNKIHDFKNNKDLTRAKE